VRRNAVGAAFSRDERAGGREVCSAKASRRGVIAALIVEREARSLSGVVVESLGVIPAIHGR